MNLNFAFSDFNVSVVKKTVLTIPLLFGLAACNSTDTAQTLDLTNQDRSTASGVAVIQGACPKVVFREGTTFYRQYARGGDGDSSKVTYQASLADATRSCRLSQDQTQLTIDVVAAGRLVAGPLGKAGDVKLPIRVAVIDRVTKGVLYTNLTTQTVNLSGATLTAQFVFNNPNVVIPAGAAKETEIFVGFDSGPSR